MQLGYTVMAVVLASGLAAAQDVSTKSKTTVKVEDGKTITVTGCVDRAPEGGYMLTNVSNKNGALGNYMLVASGEKDLHGIDKHVGHLVEVTGKAADQGKGKIKVESKAEGTTGKTESKSEVKGDLKGLSFFGVESIRMLASVCR